MKPRWLLALAALALVILAIAQSHGLTAIITAGLANRSATACGPGTPAELPVTVDRVPAVARYSPAQVRNAVIIDRVRRQLALPPRATQIALMTALIEGPNLRNPHYGDRDSQGMFQQRPSSGWGTPAQITDPVLASRAFFGMASHTRNPGLTDIPNWQTRPMGEVAQAVQRSAFPDRYQSRTAEAAALMERIGASSAATGTAAAGTAAAGNAAAALSASTDCVNGGASGAFGSWNVLRSNSLANIQAGVQAMAARADLFGLQELGDSARRQAAAAAVPGFVMTTDNTAVPIMYRSTRYTLLNQGRELAFGPNQQVEAGVDGSVVGPKWVGWAAFRDRTTGARVALVNTHLLPSVQENGRIDTSKPRRQALYDTQLRVYLTVVDRLRAGGYQVIATCDCNVSFKPNLAPILAMRAHGMLANWADVEAPPSHGSRSIDYVWAESAPVSQITGGHHGSDHRWIVVTYLSSGANSARSTGGAAYTGACTVDQGLPRRNPNSCAEAIAKARALTGQSCIWYQLCLGFTARAYGWSSGSGEYSAYTHWKNLDRLGYTHRDDRNPPPGALVFWKGSGPFGHIALAVGGGKIASNDIARRGCINIVDWTAPETQWGQSYLGWAPPYYPKGGIQG
ncbi:MAG TPA: hypothetical protein VF635_15185 [Propionibacteriaceae bacterium]